MCEKYYTSIKIIHFEKNLEQMAKFPTFFLLVISIVDVGITVTPVVGNVI